MIFDIDITKIIIWIIILTMVIAHFRMMAREDRMREKKEKILDYILEDLKLNNQQYHYEKTTKEYK